MKPSVIANDISSRVTVKRPQLHATRARGLRCCAHTAHLLNTRPFLLLWKLNLQSIVRDCLLYWSAALKKKWSQKRNYELEIQNGTLKLQHHFSFSGSFFSKESNEPLPTELPDFDHISLSYQLKVRKLSVWILMHVFGPHPRRSGRKQSQLTSEARHLAPPCELHQLHRSSEVRRTTTKSPQMRMPDSDPTVSEKHTT